MNFYKNETTTTILPISRDVNLTIGNGNFIVKIVNGHYTAPTGKYNITDITGYEKLTRIF